MIKNRQVRESQKGQALIIILLAMSVVLTVVLSSASRSVTEIATTSYEEEALRAFSAAEAGVEEKLLELGAVGEGPDTPVDLPDSSASYVVEVAEHNIADYDKKVIAYPNRLSSGESATFWLTPVSEGGQFFCDAANDQPCWEGNSVRVCYGEPGASTAPALEVSVYYDETQGSVASPNNYENVQVFRKVFDHVEESGIPRTPGSTGGTQVNEGCDYDEDEVADMPYKAVISMADIPVDPLNPLGTECSTISGSGIEGCALFIKARVLYAQDQPVEFWPTGTASLISGQGILISSEGIAGDSTRKVEVYQGLPEPPEPFDVAVYSKSGLVKAP